MFSFQHFQFAGIHAGIQSGHCWIEMATKYRKECFKGDFERSMFWDWAQNHKTVNIRNGGDQNRLFEIVELFKDPLNNYPWVKWEEDSSCNNCLTCVSIVVPEKVYAWEPEGVSIGTPITPEKFVTPITNFDQKLYELIKNTKHAI